MIFLFYSLFAKSCLFKENMVLALGKINCYLKKEGTLDI